VSVIPLSSEPLDLFFEEVPEFSKEFKDLKKKYSSLDDDLELFKKALRGGPDRVGGVVLISSLGAGVQTDEKRFYKARKFRCRSLGQYALRVIFCWLTARRKIFFIEIYSKSEKANNDSARIKKYSSQFDEVH